MEQNINHQRSNYRLLGLVGNGQFGRVYCGVHRKTGQLVAIKYLHRHSLPTHAFLRELRCLLSLAHPNIVACHAVEHCAQGRQLVLEYCAGGTLRSHMLTPLSLFDIYHLISDVLSGLAHAHQQGIVHCDVKPENILLGYHNGRWQAKVSDFGIAKLIQDSPHRKGLGQTGSPAYMAPERFYCQYSPSADVYAVGIMLFELLVGQRPFSGTPTALQSAHLNQPVPNAQQLVAPLKSIITKALEKLPARRYPSATDMLSDFQKINPVSLEIPRPPTPLSYSPYQGESFHHCPQPVAHLTVGSAKTPEAISAPPIAIAYGEHIAWLQQQILSACKTLDSPIQGLYSSPPGLMVSTQHSLWYGPEPEKLAPIIHWPLPCLVDVAHHQRWAATLTTDTKQLTILTLNANSVSGSIKRPLSPDLTLKQVLTIDSGHLVIVGHTEKTGTQLQLWNRRGMYLTSLALGLHLHQLTRIGQSHQWMAIDSQAPKTVIFLTFKPLRISRITLDISPTIMMALPWGYLFCDAAGQMILLDRDFSPIGGIQGPAGITAIATSSPYEIIVAAWDLDSATGTIHHLNLQEFDLDIIF
ncbi:MAG: serine/threonine-protein kinase [Cyanobacteria bacterium P01_F01_bin.116]